MSRHAFLLSLASKLTTGDPELALVAAKEWVASRGSRTAAGRLFHSVGLATKEVRGGLPIYTLTDEALRFTYVVDEVLEGKPRAVEHIPADVDLLEVDTRFVPADDARSYPGKPVTMLFNRQEEGFFLYTGWKSRVEVPR